MQKTILPLQMKALETEVIRSGIVTGEQLMNRAAEHLCEAVSQRMEAGGCAVFVCGCGNNGGDGFCAAAKLLTKRRDVQVLCLQLQGTLSPDCRREREKLLALFGKDSRLQLQVFAADEMLPKITPSVVVDALFGTGLDRPLQGDALQLCHVMNAWCEQGTYCIACDIPSGLNGTDGRILGACVTANETVTFHRPKVGLLLREGPNVCGVVKTVSIGLEGTDADKAVDGLQMLTHGQQKKLLPKRKAVSHKGDYGRILILCGSLGMAGAAAICANAALRTGVGLCTVAAPLSIVPTVQVLAPCATCLPLEENEASLLRLSQVVEGADAVAVGCGLGQSVFAQKATECLLNRCMEKEIPCVVDADGLNLLAGPLRQRFTGAFLYLTPHAGEAARLLQTTVKQVTEEPLDALRALCRSYGAHVLLKGARSVMQCPNGTMAVNPSGTPALAKGGSGDTLTGILTALLAGIKAGCYTMNGLEAMQLACSLHTGAAQKARQIYGERGLLATDVLAYLGCDFE